MGRVMSDRMFIHRIVTYMKNQGVMKLSLVIEDKREIVIIGSTKYRDDLRESIYSPVVKKSESGISDPSFQKRLNSYYTRYKKVFEEIINE